MEHRKNKIAHQLRDGYDGRNVWLFFALPKGLEFTESLWGADEAYREAKATLFKHDNLPAGGAPKGEDHWVHQSRIIGWMDTSRQFHENPNFDSDKLAEEYKADGY